MYNPFSSELVDWQRCGVDGAQLTSERRRIAGIEATSPHPPPLSTLWPAVPEVAPDLAPELRTRSLVLKVQLPDGPTTVKVFQTPEGVRPVLGWVTPRLSFRRGPRGLFFVLVPAIVFGIVSQQECPCLGILYG